MPFPGYGYRISNHLPVESARAASRQTKDECATRSDSSPQRLRSAVTE